MLTVAVARAVSDSDFVDDVMFSHNGPLWRIMCITRRRADIVQEGLAVASIAPMHFRHRQTDGQTDGH